MITEVVVKNIFKILLYALIIAQVLTGKPWIFPSGAEFILKLNK